MIRTVAILWGLSLTCSPLLAQQGRAENTDGNSLYERGLYEEALSKYEEALRKNPESPIIKFNSGSAQYKVKAFDEALEAFHATSTAEDQRLRAQSYYNLGNTQYRKGSLQDAVESYKQALRLDPNDVDAKYNLEYVLKELKENPPQESQQQNENQQDQQQEDQDDQQQEDGDQQSDEQQQEQEDQKSEGDGDASQEQDQQQHDNSDSEDQQEEPQDRQNQQQEKQGESSNKEDPQSNADMSEAAPMTREQVEQILQALREDQADFLRKRTVKRKPAVAGKDW